MKTLATILATGVLALSLISASSATEPGVKESLRHSIGAAKDAFRNIGRDGKELGRGISTAAKDTGQAIGRGAKGVANDVSTGFRRDFIEGGVKRGPRPAQPEPGLNAASAP